MTQITSTNDWYKVMYYDEDYVDHTLLVVRGEKRASAIVETLEHRYWLGLTERGMFNFVALPATIDDITRMRDKNEYHVIDSDISFRPWVEEHPEEPVYVHVIEKFDEKPQVYFYAQHDVKEPCLWAQAFTKKYPDGTVSKCYKAMFCDFNDCHTEEECKQRAIEISKQLYFSRLVK